jgi:hypothetical protein
MTSSTPRRTYLEMAVRLLRGMEQALDTLGWDRAYAPPKEGEAVYSHGLTEAQLAKYQKNQGQTNDCGAYAIAAAISLLADTRSARPTPTADAAGEGEPPLRGFKGRVDYDDAVATADRQAALRRDGARGLVDFLGGRDLRLWPGGPSMPRQQAALARLIGQQHRFDVTAIATRGTADDLLFFLRQPNAEVLVTLGWGPNKRPRIQHPDGKLRAFNPPDKATVAGRVIQLPFGAHVMLLAAYDPAHTAKSGRKAVAAPWGFVNSWIDGGDGLYWMPEDDFRRAWRYVIPGVGRQKMVVIRRGGL